MSNPTAPHCRAATFSRSVSLYSDLSEHGALLHALIYSVLSALAALRVGTLTHGPQNPHLLPGRREAASETASTPSRRRMAEPI